MNFDIKTEQLSDDTYVISLAGEIDLYTAPEFKQQLLEVIGEGASHVVVDLTATTFIDSTTIGCTDPNITKIFEITGLDRVFDITQTRDDAVSKLADATPHTS